MNVFYFTLLSDFLNATAKLKYDFEIEDAHLLLDLSEFFKKRSLKEVDV